MHPKPRSARLWLHAVGLTISCIPVITGSSAVAGDDEPDHTVLLTNIEFRPNRLRIVAGDTVRFTNKDKFNHDVYLVRTANRNDVLFPATTVASGQSVTVTIEDQGLYTLYCTIHGGMTGKITTTDTFELTEEERARAAARHVVPPIVKTGEELYWGRAQCHRCHMVEERGTNLRGPNHQDLGFRAQAQAQKLGLSSGTEYIVQSIMDPSAYLVEGYTDDMPKVYQAPIDLTKEDIIALVAYLQSQGGEVDTWSININQQILETELAASPFRGGDPRRGKAVLGEMSCNSCHTVADRIAVSVGPELTAIGAFRNWTWLAQAIVDPNAEVGANWRDATVYLKPGVSVEGEEFEEESIEDEEFFDDDTSESRESGGPAAARLAQARAEMEALRTLISQLEQRNTESKHEETGLAPPAREADVESESEHDYEPDEDADSKIDFEFGESVLGVLRNESADEVTLMVGWDRLETFPRDQVAGVVVSKQSRMPTNYGELMTFQQLADLLSYLELLKGPA